MPTPRWTPSAPPPARDAADAGFDDAAIRRDVCADSPSMLRLTRTPHDAEHAPFAAWLAHPGRDEY
ncbi:hypothetical protein [Kytococcus schroeteri]|nr:hypothetical protein [Kytococcus schroeteri]